MIRKELRVVNGRALAARRSAIALAMAGIVAAASCATGGTSFTIADICSGHTVALYLAVQVDSVYPPPGATLDPSLERLEGQRYEVLLNLINLFDQSLLLNHKCSNRGGEASLSGSLPDLLQRAVSSRKQSARWSVFEKQVNVDLNPGVFDRDLEFTLPLEGGEGTWELVENARLTASGRLIPR